jgi:heme exporter protein A
MMRLKANSLQCSRGGRVLFSGLGFECEAGECIIVRGPNGAGKSTLMRAIAGFYHFDHGSVELEGADPEKALRELCHFVGHTNAIKPGLTVLENLRFMADFFEVSRPDAVDAALDAYNLMHLSYLPAGYLSAGQKRRVALARLSLAERPLWLLDEPTVSLDTASTAFLSGIITKHLSQGGLAIIATHTPLDVAASRVLEIGGARPAVSQDAAA